MKNLVPNVNVSRFIFIILLIVALLAIKYMLIMTVEGLVANLSSGNHSVVWFG